MLDDHDRMLKQARRTHGYLQKKSSGFFAFWQKRYFNIVQQYLCYYEDQTMQQIKKKIAVADIKHIKVIDQNQFQIFTKHRVYQLRAQYNSTRDLWVGSLQLLTQQQSPKTSQVTISTNPKISPDRESSKRQSPRKYSRAKKMSTHMSPIGSKAQSRPSKWKIDFSPISFLETVCLHKLSDIFKQENIQNKILFIREAKGCYFVISCKTILYSHEDEDFLSTDLVQPYDFNCLYYYQYEQQSPQVVEVCKCKDFTDIKSSAESISIELQTKNIEIFVQKKRMQVIDMQSIINKLKSTKAISEQYHNGLGIVLKKNCDRLFFRNQNKQISLKMLAQKELQRCITQSKDTKQNTSKTIQFRKSVQIIKNHLVDIINCYRIKQLKNTFQQTPFIQQFSQFFVTEFTQYFNKKWDKLNSGISITNLKKMTMNLYDFNNSVIKNSKSDWFQQKLVTIQNRLIQQYQKQLISKMSQCFDLSESQLITEVNIHIKNQQKTVSQMQEKLLSNIIFRQFDLDIRFMLFEFSQLPIKEKTIPFYCLIFTKIFAQLQKNSIAKLDKWKSPQLLLGTCNQIQFKKHTLLQEISNTLKSSDKNIQNKIATLIPQLEQVLNSIQILVFKKLFVITFKDLNHKELKVHSSKLNLQNLSLKIIGKLNRFTKINQYVRAKIYQSCFQQICFFYYICTVHQDPNKPDSSTRHQFINKIVNDVRILGQIFKQNIQKQKLEAHLQQLNLLHQAMSCQMQQLPSFCKKIKEVYGTSFNLMAFNNILQLREQPNPQNSQTLLACFAIAQNPQEQTELMDDSLISSQSFLDNFANSRSRKSTINCVLDELNAGNESLQKQSMQMKKTQVQIGKSYLCKKIVTKENSKYQPSTFFRIAQGKLYQYENNIQNKLINVYSMAFLLKCFRHPQKPYIFIIQFSDIKLQLKAESTEQASMWLDTIMQEINLLNQLKRQSLKTTSKQSSHNSHIISSHNSPRLSKQESMSQISQKAEKRSLSKKKKHELGSPLLPRKNSMEEQNVRSKSPVKKSTRQDSVRFKSPLKSHRKIPDLTRQSSQKVKRHQ